MNREQILEMYEDNFEDLIQDYFTIENALIVTIPTGVVIALITWLDSPILLVFAGFGIAIACVVSFLLWKTQRETLEEAADQYESDYSAIADIAQENAELQEKNQQYEAQFEEIKKQIALFANEQEKEKMILFRSIQKEEEKNKRLQLQLQEASQVPENTGMNEHQVKESNLEAIELYMQYLKAGRTLNQSKASEEKKELAQSIINQFQQAFPEMVEA